MRTRRPFKAYLAWDAEAGKVNFEFEPRASKFPPRKTSGAASAKTATAKAAAKSPPGEVKATARAAKAVAKKAAPAKKAPAKKAAAPRKTGPGLKPSPALAAVVGDEPIARTEVIKRIWDYIKANGLQDKKDKRAINADAKLKPVFGKNQVTMFELAGIVGKHLSSE
jgi:DNA topoisomerase-3